VCMRRRKLIEDALAEGGDVEAALREADLV
jgi:hypothetical protein